MCTSEHPWRPNGRYRLQVHSLREPSGLLYKDCCRNCWMFQHRNCVLIWACHFPVSLSWLPVAINSWPPLASQARYVLASFLSSLLLWPDRTDYLLSTPLCLYYCFCLESSTGLWPHGELLFIILQDWTLFLWRLYQLLPCRLSPCPYLPIY